MQVGFGGYRISNRSDEHRKALTLALRSGCKLIDTSSNYTSGESETLIGEVIKETGIRPIIITKAGYIQGATLDKIGKLDDDLEVVEFSEGLSHSIDPRFLKTQIDQSLERLGVESLDSVLLHNPEYFLKKRPGEKTEYYRRIGHAFSYLKSEVEKGRVRSFGVSSNTLVDPRDDDTATDLEELIKAAKKTESLAHFKYLQFPMNLLELGALQPQYEGKNLAQRAKELGLVTLINRPLNAFSSAGLLRLSDKEAAAPKVDPQSYFEERTRPLIQKWEEAKEEGDEELNEVPLFLQIKKIWAEQASEDAVQQIFFGHFFPFIANVYGRDLRPEESRPYYDLYEMAIKMAKSNMAQRAKLFASQAEESGLLAPSDEGLAIRSLKKYAETGVDYALVGMRQVSYVEELKRFF